jgi:hypothetical protein
VYFFSGKLCCREAMMKQVLLVVALAAVASAIPHIAPIEQSIEAAIESVEEKIKSRVHEVFMDWKSKVGFVHISFVCFLLSLIWLFFYVVGSYLTHQWSLQFNRFYDGTEHENRFEIFKANFAEIEKHNALFELGDETFRLGLNQFSDMSNDEYKKFLGFNPSLRKYSNSLALGKACTHDGLSINASVDWRAQKAGEKR